MTVQLEKLITIGVEHLHVCRLFTEHVSPMQQQMHLQDSIVQA